jgi:hypothetical protein
VALLVCTEKPGIALEGWRRSSPFRRLECDWFSCAQRLFFFDFRNADDRKQSNQKIGLYAVLLNYVLIMGQTSHFYRFQDYGGYEKAAIGMAQGKALYGDTYHLNLPLVGELIAGAYQTLHAIFSEIQPIIPDLVFACGVFYLFQCLQLALTGWGYWLSTNWLTTLGIGRERSILICALLWILSWPVYLTLQKGQINILLVDLTLLPLIWLNSNPIRAGMALAVGFFLKVYPVGLVAAAVITKRWKLVGAFAAGIVLLIILQTIGGGITIWSQLFNALQQKHLNDPFYDIEAQIEASPMSAAFIICRAFAPACVTRDNPTVPIVSYVITAVIVAWFAWRIWVRERAYRQQLPGTPDAGKNDLELSRFYGHMADILSGGMIASPHVWQNHYVMALPAILWAIACRGGVTPLLLAAIAFMQVSNHFDRGTAAYMVLAFLRPLGLILLTISQNPKSLLNPSQKLSGQADDDKIE